MKIKPTKFELIQGKSGKARMVKKGRIKVEIRISDHVIVFRMPRPKLFKIMEEWIAQYEYDYFRDPQSELGDGIILRPIWEKDEIPRKPSQKLKYFRTGQKLTQVELAKMAWTTQANIAYMEKGQRPIGKKIAKRLGDALEVDYRVFL